MIGEQVIFYVSSLLMLISVIFLLRVNSPMHGALYLIASLIALAINFYLLGAPLLAMFQVILYVGAIMVLYVFFIMMNSIESSYKKNNIWIPLLLLLVLGGEILFLLFKGDISKQTITVVNSSAYSLGMELFSRYKLAIEIISTLLLVALIAVMHLARPLCRGKKK